MRATPITIELVKNLLLRREDDKLDFKEMDYDWVKRDPSRAELAKDLIAIANRLSQGDTPSYILVGVRDALI